MLLRVLRRHGLRLRAREGAASRREGVRRLYSDDIQLESFKKIDSERNFSKKKHPLTKIVCTIGPASEDSETLQKIVASGMRVMRLNFSHASYEEASMRISRLRACRGMVAKSNMRAVMLDTQGPEIRTGRISPDEAIEGTAAKPTIRLVEGDEVIVTPDRDSTGGGLCTSNTIWVSYPSLSESVAEGSSILLDDGLIELSVKGVDSASGNVTCRVENSGMLGERKGVNLPGSSVDLPPLTDKDRADIRYGIENDVDYIAASFVRKGEDVKAIKEYVREVHSEYWHEEHPLPGIIAKIESQEALDNFDAILEESYGIMVARGDLGVEIPYENVTLAQKEMILRCNLAGKPVIVATQMLESMGTNPRPTRAEVSDVTNAVLDGADAVMLSGESANGRYPVQSVKTLWSIANEADKFVSGSRLLESLADTSSRRGSTKWKHMESIEALAYSTAKASREMKAACIIIMTATGKTARYVSKFRPSVPILAYVTNRKMGRQLMLHRGVHPYCHDERIDGLHATPEDAVKRAKELGLCGSGDVVLLLSSVPKAGGGFDVAMRIRNVT